VIRAINRAIEMTVTINEKKTGKEVNTATKKIKREIAMIKDATILHDKIELGAISRIVRIGNNSVDVSCRTMIFA
jgi:hypothetical protein